MRWFQSEISVCVLIKIPIIMLYFQLLFDNFHYHRKLFFQMFQIHVPDKSMVLVTVSSYFLILYSYELYQYLIKKRNALSVIGYNHDKTLQNNYEMLCFNTWFLLWSREFQCNIPIHLTFKQAKRIGQHISYDLQKENSHYRI